MPRTKMPAKRTPRPSSCNDTDPFDATYPWPRMEGVPIDLSDPKIPAVSLDKWDKTDSRCYNALLEVTIAPTRVVHAQSMRELGIHDDLHSVLGSMGIEGLCYDTYPLYEDAVRQCLASAQITYADSNNPTFETAIFSFFVNGAKFQLPMATFNEVYKLEDEPSGLTFPKKFAPAQQFWELIAHGQFMSRSANQSQIRNPALRIAAKVLSNVLFSKEITARVSSAELQMLYSGVEDEIRESGAGIPKVAAKANPGFALATMFVAKKAKTQTTERCGSLLTPIFERCCVDLLHYKVNTQPEYIDTQYLLQCHILRDETTYAFQDQAGLNLFCKLPQPAITNLETFTNIRFLPDPEYLCADPLAPPPAHHDEDMHDGGAFTEEYAAPDEAQDGQYDLGPLEDTASEQEYRRWMVDSQRKNNSLMKRILRAITGGCLQSPREARAPEQRRDEQRRAADTSGAGTSGDGARLNRNRRSAGQSDSEDTE